ncbi:MAG: DUF2087 domain-containing protein [Dehalococcoidia bacterium]
MSDPAIPAPSPEVQRFLDREGRLRQWPAKKRAREAVLAWLMELFEPGRRYSEREVGDVLLGAHSFGDPAFLRRELCDHGHLARETDGSAYWRPDPQPNAR